jgi:Rhs element Vgr protein
MSIPFPGQNVPVLSLRYTVKVNGTAIDDTIGVSSLSIRHEINKISLAEITLSGPAAADGSSISFSDGDTFAPGNPVVISAAYGDDAEITLFTGVIVKHAIEMRGDSVIQLKVQCKHAAIRMTFGRREQEFKDKTDSAIMQALVGAYGISVAVDSTTYQNELFLQKLATDWDLILSRAEFNGMLIFLDTDTLTIGKPKFTTGPVLRVAPGEGLIDFQAELNVERQAPSVEASAWDVKTLALQKATGTEPSLNAQGSVSGKDLSGKLSQVKTALMSMTPMAADELKAWADNHLLRMRLSAIKGSVTFTGSALVKTGSLIQLEGVGSKFNGKAFVSAVLHKMEEGHWKTTARFGLESKYINERPDFSYLPATGQAPAIHGLQVATVKQLAEDPQSMYRILVTLPSNAETQNGIWARYANFYATANAGAGFLPEVGDEVVVAFIENDPRYPVVLGSLYSSTKQSPNQAKDEKNYIKSLTTKSQLKVQFDDEKKIITIETPGGNKITLSDDAKGIEIADQNSNSIKMSSSGIALSSAKDITLDAKGNITISATGKLSLSAKQDLASEGMNVTCTAQMGFTAKGNATAELSASGQTTVKGGIVMIN